MILGHQLKTIEDAVARGYSLSQEMSSALLAAFHEADTAHKATVFQMAQVSGQKQDLEWERDQTLKLQSELEKQVDERVALRTADLRDEVSNANYAASNAKRDMREAKEQAHLLRQQLAKAAEALDRYRNVVETKLLTTSWWRKFMWMHTTKGAILRIEKLVPSDTLDTWRSYAEEAEEAEPPAQVN